ncbi:MAG: MFS transporter [Thermosediminibacteraceae bacterium]|nr:MFS transporter [Thermosediminibacteraceae bacterium]
MERIKTLIATRFPALTHRNFRLFWTGQCISLVGTWMQNIGQAWLVLKITDSSFKLGLVNALQFTPVLLFSLFAGVFIDRFEKKKIIIFTQTSLMVMAFMLATLTATGLVRYWHIAIMATILGFINSLDMPARQSFVVDLVGKDHLMNGITLNSAVFNAARLVGPAVAGFIMGQFGIAVCFFLNALSFIAVLNGLFKIRVEPKSKNHINAAEPIIDKIKEGLNYIKKTPTVRITVSLVALVSIFTLNFNVTVPVLARKVFSLSEQGFGLMMSSLGVGALAGSLLLSATIHRPSPVILIASAFCLSAAEIILSTLQSPWAAMLCLVFIGGMMVTFTASANSTIQFNVPDHLRGRVMSVYALVFAGMTPLGSLFTGYISSNLGGRASFAIGGFLGCVFAACALFLMKNVMTLSRHTKTC